MLFRSGVTVGRGVGAGVTVGRGVGAGVTVGRGVGAGVTVGRGVGAGVAVGAAVGATVGVAVGVGLGDGGNSFGITAEDWSERSWLPPAPSRLSTRMWYGAPEILKAALPTPQSVSAAICPPQASTAVVAELIKRTLIDVCRCAPKALAGRSM